MARATVLTLTNIEATSDVVTSPASQGFMSCRNTGRAYRLLISGCRYFAATPMMAMARAMGRQKKKAIHVERFADRTSLVELIAWITNWVQKMEPMVPISQAKMVPAPMLPSHVQ